MFYAGEKRVLVMNVTNQEEVAIKNVSVHIGHGYVKFARII